MASPELLVKSNMENVAIPDAARKSLAAKAMILEADAQQNFSRSALNFATCHHFKGSSSTSSSPAHWHQEIEIIHCLSGKGFVHVCQCKSQTFDAPAIIVVPSNMIHRTMYPANCIVNRVLFSADDIMLAKQDNALSYCMQLLEHGVLKTSIIYKSTDAGYERAEEILLQLERLVARPTLLSVGSNDHVIKQFKDKINCLSAENDIDDSIQRAALDIYVSEHYDKLIKGTSALEDIPVKRKRGRPRRKTVKLNLQNVNLQGSNAYNAAAAFVKNQTDPNGSTSEITAEDLAKFAASLGGIAANDANSSEAINANSISIAKAQEFDQSDSMENRILEVHQSLGVGLQIKSLLLNLLGTMFTYGHITESRPSRRHRINRNSDEKIKNMLTYIHSNYNHAISIGDLAVLVDVTNQYFCRFFKHLTDRSFVDYLNDLRLQKAAVDIATTTLPIREISVRHGFETIGYFFKLFREHYKTTPIKYRKSFMQEIPELDEVNDLNRLDTDVDPKTGDPNQSNEQVLSKTGTDNTEYDFTVAVGNAIDSEDIEPEDPHFEEVENDATKPNRTTSRKRRDTQV